MLKLKTFFFVFAVALAFTACKKTSTNTSNDDTGDHSTANCKACTYVPDCVGITYTYIDSTIGGSNATRNIAYTGLNDTTIGGVVFQKVSSSGSPASYNNCTNGITTTIGYNVTSVSGNITLSEIKLVPLQANAALNATWMDTINNSGEIVEYAYTMAEKGISRTVNGTNFTDVIHVNVQDSLNVVGYGNLSTGSTDYYYANNIGLIEADIYEYGSLFEITYLKAYNIPQ